MSVGVSEAEKNRAPNTIPTPHSDCICRLMNQVERWIKLTLRIPPSRLSTDQDKGPCDPVKGGPAGHRRLASLSLETANARNGKADLYRAIRGCCCRCRHRRPPQPAPNRA